MYEKVDDTWVDQTENTAYLLTRLADATEIKVVGILRPAKATSVGTVTGTVGYRGDLMEHLIQLVNQSEIVKEQQADPNTDIFTGLAFSEDDAPVTAENLQAYMQTLPEEQQVQIGGYIEQLRASGMSEDEIATTILSANETTNTYEGNLQRLGVVDVDTPSAISLYPKDFEAKEKIVKIIDQYNQDAGEDDALTYTDFIGVMMESVTTIINAISYILIAFVAISLVVSCIMIGIITHISVMERTKEIGILRALGASKRNISQVFNAETFIIGCCAGLLGIGVSLLALFPINAVIAKMSGLSDLTAQLPVQSSAILVVISIVITILGGLIPAKKAAKKDPVIALRTE